MSLKRSSICDLLQRRWETEW